MALLAMRHELVAAPRAGAGMSIESEENNMGNESPEEDRPTTIERVVLGVAALFAVAVVALFPECAWAHGGEKHGALKAEPAVTVATEAPEAPEPAHEADEHEHSSGSEEVAEAPSGHPYPPEGVPRPFAWLGKFHPVATHFPIALLSVAALAELLLLRRPSELFEHAVRFSVWGGAVGALIAAPLGWFFAGFHIFDDSWVMTAHRWVGTGTALWALLVLMLCERTYRNGAKRRPFRLALLLGAALVGATGFLGGSLIYGLDHYAW